MIQIDISSDIDQAMSEVHSFWRGQLPFATSRALNSTALDVQKRLRGSTIPSAWTNRNKALARAMTTFIADDEGGGPGLANYRKGKWSVVIGAARNSKGYVAGEGFSERQVTGARKLPKGTAIAIPIEGPGLRRGAGGAIPAAKRAKNRRHDKNLFRRGNVLFEKQRGGKKIVPRYVLATQAAGTGRLRRFYPDAQTTALRVFSGHWNTAMNSAIRNSRFFPG